uniref:HGWP repeat containing protein-like n=1 Tax=Oryza sativa subsp. japonica TaxID=39947 RepID=Q6YVP4_ORYSJ|nr:hypothetical protein [Oryza sativa Japonica Group]
MEPRSPRPFPPSPAALSPSRRYIFAPRASLLRFRRSPLALAVGFVLATSTSLSAVAADLRYAADVAPGFLPSAASPPSASPRRRRPRPPLRFARRPPERRRPRRPEPRRRLLPLRPPFPSSPSIGVSRGPLRSLPPSLLSLGCHSAAPLVAGGDHRGAGAPFSRRPCRRGRLRARPRGCQVGPAVSRPRPRVRLTRGTHGAGRRQPHAAASEDPLFVEVEAGVWESEQGKSHHP